MIRLLVVWTLRRGIVDPPEPLDAANQAAAQKEALLASMVRDPHLTQKQWMEEEGFRSMYIRKNRRIA